MDDVNADACADEAALLGIKISVVYVPFGGVDATESAIMSNYASHLGR